MRKAPRGALDADLELVRTTGFEPACFWASVLKTAVSTNSTTSADALAKSGGVSLIGDLHPSRNLLWLFVHRALFCEKTYEKSVS